MANSNININDGSLLWRRVEYIGYTRFINIADGNYTDVPWGPYEWSSVVLSTTFAVILIGLGLHLFKVI